MAGGFVARYRAPYLGFRNSDGLTEAQPAAGAAHRGRHAIGIGHIEPLPRESMLVDGLADVTGPAPGCENFQQDLLPPRVLTQTPAPDARGVGRLTNVTVGFDEPVDGLGTSTFTLSGPAGPVPPRWPTTARAAWRPSIPSRGPPTPWPAAPATPPP